MMKMDQNRHSILDRSFFCIMLIVLVSYGSILFQIEYWPFSSYPMFNSNFGNVKENHVEGYYLGVKLHSDNWMMVSDQEVIGSIRKGALPFYLKDLINRKNYSSVDALLTYWHKRFMNTSFYKAKPIPSGARLGIIKIIKSKDLVIVKPTDWNVKL